MANWCTSNADVLKWQSSFMVKFFRLKIKTTCKVRIFNSGLCLHLFWEGGKKMWERGGKKRLVILIMHESQPRIKWMTYEENISLNITLSRIPCRGKHFFHSVHPPTAAGGIQDEERQRKLYLLMLQYNCQTTFFKKKKKLNTTNNNKKLLLIRLKV